MVALSTLDWAGSVTADVITRRFVTGHVGQADDSHQKPNLFHLATCIIKNLAPNTCADVHIVIVVRSVWEKTLINNIQFTVLTVFYTTLFFLSRLCCVSAMARFVKDSSIKSIFPVKQQYNSTICATINSNKFSDPGIYQIV